MKPIRTLLVLAIIAAFSISAAAFQSQTSPQQNGGDTSSNAVPILVLDSFTHDFGEVKPGTTLRYAFKVKNEGKADLLINNVAPS
jgi:hypothetical protein